MLHARVSIGRTGKRAGVTLTVKMTCEDYLLSSSMNGRIKGSRSSINIHTPRVLRSSLANAIQSQQTPINLSAMLGSP